MLIDPFIRDIMVVFIGLMLVFLVCIDIFWIRKRAADEVQAVVDASTSLEFVMETLYQQFQLNFIYNSKAPEYIVLPVRPVYDLLSKPDAAAYLQYIAVQYQEKFGELNVDKHGNKFEVKVRGKDGRFLA